VNGRTGKRVSGRTGAGDCYADVCFAEAGVVGGFLGIGAVAVRGIIKPGIRGRSLHKHSGDSAQFGLARGGSLGYDFRLVQMRLKEFFSGKNCV